MSLITKADLHKDLSEQELQELTDINGDGAMNETVLADVIEETAGLIASYLPIPPNPSILLKTMAARLAVYELKRRNGLLSQQDREDHKDNEARLLKMATGKLQATAPDAHAVLVDSSGESTRPLTAPAFVHQGEPMDLEEWE